MSPVPSDFARQEAEFGIALSAPYVNDGPRDCFEDAPFRVFHTYVLGHIYSGEGYLQIKGRRQVKRLQAGSVVIVSPGIPNVYGGISGSDYREDFIFFSGRAFERMAGCRLLETGCFPFGINRQLPMIAELLRNPQADFQFKARLKFMNLLLEIHASKTRMPGTQKLDSLLAELAVHPEAWWTVEEMAGRCGCSASQFRRNFLEHTGMLPKQYIETMKMHRAAELLQHPTETIDSICSQLGYNDRFHFSRRFRQLMGVPPARYRKIYQNP